MNVRLSVIGVVALSCALMSPFGSHACERPRNATSSSTKVILLFQMRPDWLGSRGPSRLTTANEPCCPLLGSLLMPFHTVFHA